METALFLALSCVALVVVAGALALKRARPGPNEVLVVSRLNQEPKICSTPVLYLTRLALVEVLRVGPRTLRFRREGGDAPLNYRLEPFDLIVEIDLVLDPGSPSLLDVARTLGVDVVADDASLAEAFEPLVASVLSAVVGRRSNREVRVGLEALGEEIGDALRHRLAGFEVRGTRVSFPEHAPGSPPQRGPFR